MTRSRWPWRWAPALAGWAIAVLMVSCASGGAGVSGRPTLNQQTAVGAGFGAGSGTTALSAGQLRADELLAGTATLGADGGGDEVVGTYIDRQEERLARIPGAVVQRLAEDTLLIRFDSDALFKLGSDAFESGARGTLDDVAKVLARESRTAVVIQGHTCATGEAARNQELSERRAGAVLEFFAGRGVEPDRMVAVGYGERDPVAANTTVEGRRVNRRINLVVKAAAR